MTTRWPVPELRCLRWGFNADPCRRGSAGVVACASRATSAIAYRPQTDHIQTTPERYEGVPAVMAAATRTRPDLQKRRSGRMWITLARMVWDAEVGSSNLPHPTTKSPGQTTYFDPCNASFEGAIPRPSRADGERCLKGRRWCGAGPARAAPCGDIS